MRVWLQRPARQVRRRWRRSLRFRVVLATVAGSSAVLLLLLPALLGRISSGILAAQQESALAEATAARSEAQSLLDAPPEGSEISPARRIDAVVAAMGARGAQGGLFEVLVLASEPAGLNATPERGTNLVSESSVPGEMRRVVAGSQHQAWTYTTIRYTDGRSTSGLIVGAPLAVSGVGPYELYQLFPLDREHQTLQLVRDATAVAGLLIVAGLAVLAMIVTFTVVQPVHDAARTARRFSAGTLDVRMPVRGEDDLAQLAISFNAMADRLESQITRLEAMSAVQSRFVADVSHELRTPMATVRMAADLLHDHRAELPPDQARAVELLHRQLNRFESLLADLLETSRHDAGAVRLEMEDVDLRVLAERAVTMLDPLAHESAVPIEVIAPGEVRVRCDPQRVERIVGNLVSNAIEHAEGKPVEVLVAGDVDTCTVTVQDHGVGLDADALESVFTRFWRADPSRVRRIGGTGLGLSIALGDARAHRGALTASGAPGEGATFVLTLPRDSGES